jgi:IclR family transcriptional regulator, KDG regulon repressor
MKNFTIGAVDNALKLIEVFLKEERELGISELAQLSGMNVSTAHHIVSTLAAKGYLIQKHHHGPYSLGFKFLEIGNSVKSQLHIGEVARPFLKKLNTQVDESTNLAIVDSNEAVYIEQMESSQTLRIFTKVGKRVPLHCTGVGKLFLACMKDDQFKTFLGAQELTPSTPNTITSVDKLRKELSTIREQGYALDNEEKEAGITCIAAAVRNSEGSLVAAISVSGPSTRINDGRLKQLAPLVKSCGLEISRALGYRGN